MKFNICKVNREREQEKKMKSAFDHGEIEMKILDEIIEDKAGEVYEEYEFKHESDLHKDKSVSTVLNTMNDDD